MRVREPRFLTIAIIVVSCGWVAARGFAFAHYEFAAQSLAGNKNPFDILGPWAGQPGLSSLVLDESLRVRTDPTDLQGIQKRRDALVDLLSVRPIASRSWLALVAVQNSLRAPPAKIIDDFSMSALTGPNEGALMYQRSLLGVVLWESFTPEARARVVLDLVGLTVFDPAQFRNVLATKPKETRAEIRAALEANGCPPKRIEYIGL